MLLSLIGRSAQKINEFFKHESRKFPPSLADDQGRLRTGTLSDIMGCLEKLLKNSRLQAQSQSEEPQLTDVNQTDDEIENDSDNNICQNENNDN